LIKVKSSAFQERRGKKLYNPNSYGYLDAGLSFLIFTIVFVIYVRLYRLIMPYTGKLVQYVRKDYYFNMVFSSLIVQGFIILYAFIYSRIRRVSLFSGGGYTIKFDVINMSMACLLCFGVFLVFKSLHLEISDHFDFLFPANKNPELKGNVLWGLLYILVLVPLFPAFCEEALMRGIIFRSLEKFGVFFAIIVSGFMFGIFHGNPSQLFLQSLGGMALAVAFYATKNFMVVIAMHFFNNFFGTIYEVILEILSDKMPKTYSWVFILSAFLGLICLIVSGVYFYKKITKKKTVNENISHKKRVFLLNPQTNVITENYAFNTCEIEERLNRGELFLKGSSFQSKNSLGNKILGFILICVSVIVGILEVFGVIDLLFSLIL